jgi:F-type H+-transporting ATPase subunit epsilon
MPDLIQLEVATPERLLVREEVSDVQVPGKEGYLGVLPGHAPLLGQLGTGFLSYQAGSHRRYLAVAGGFLEVLPDHVRVLANHAERAEEIDLERARADVRRLMGEVMNPSIGVDPANALDLLMHAQARVDAAEKK